MLIHAIYEIFKKMVCYKLVMKYVERRNVGGTMGIRGGGMKRSRKQYTKKVAYKKMCKN